VMLSLVLLAVIGTAQQTADVTDCTGHADCDNVQGMNDQGQMQNIGATYCYDVGKYTSGTASNVFKCAGNTNDCCSCMYDDSFDANAANCPAASDCTTFCATCTAGSMCDYTRVLAVMTAAEASTTSECTSAMEVCSTCQFSQCDVCTSEVCSCFASDNTLKAFASVADYDCKYDCKAPDTVKNLAGGTGVCSNSSSIAILLAIAAAFWAF